MVAPTQQHAVTRACLYLRYSSSNQREESITAQNRACTAYCDSKGYAVIGSFSDEERTATSDDRPGFLSMINDIAAGRIKADVVVVHKLDRFARNRYDSAYYRRKLRAANCRIESVLEHLDGSPESILMESLYEGMAEFYSANLAREVHKGMKETALQGKHNGGRPPLGYQIREQQYVIDEREAESVRLIFALYVAGCSYGHIIDELAARGHLTGEGRPFRKSSLHGILSNEKYTGVYIFNRSAPKGVSGKRNHHASKREEEIIRIPGAMPAIIDAATWEKAQERMSGRKRAENPRAKVSYLLSGLGVCGLCGRAIVGSAQGYTTRVSKQPRARNVYICTGSKLREGDKCRLPRTDKEEIEAAAISALQTQLFSEGVIRSLIKMAASYAKRREKDSGADGDRIAGEIKALANRIRNIVETIGSIGTITPKALLEELGNLERAKSDAESRLERWRLMNEEKPDGEEIAVYLRAQRDRLYSDDTAIRREILHRFIEKIEFNSEGAIIHLVIKSGPAQDGGYGWWRRAVPVLIPRHR